MCCVQVWLLLGASGVAVGLMAGALEVLNRIDMPGAHMPSRRSKSTAELTGQLRPLHSSSMSALISWVSSQACAVSAPQMQGAQRHHLRTQGWVSRQSLLAACRCPCLRYSCRNTPSQVTLDSSCTCLRVVPCRLAGLAVVHPGQTVSCDPSCWRPDFRCYQGIGELSDVDSDLRGVGWGFEAAAAFLLRPACTVAVATPPLWCGSCFSYQ